MAQPGASRPPPKPPAAPRPAAKPASPRQPTPGRPPPQAPRAPQVASPPFPSPDPRAGPSGWDGHDLHHAGRPRITWSGQELMHLAMGVLAITFCFSLIRATGTFPANLLAIFDDPWNLLASFIAVTTGFVLHELAHKIVAQRYGHWAEFRADFRYLGIGVVIAAFMPFFVAAPGAVWIQGRPAPRQYGLISIVGPGVNVLVSGLAFGIYWMLRLTDPRFGVNISDDALWLVLAMVAFVNGLLAVFNLIPFNLPFLGSLDGLKVWRWSKLGWLASFAVAVGLFSWVFYEVGLDLFPPA